MRRGQPLHGGQRVFDVLDRREPVECRRDAAPGRKDTRGVQIDHGFAERSTFVVTPDGRVAAAFDGLSPVENVDHALAAVQRLAQ